MYKFVGFGGTGYASIDASTLNLNRLLDAVLILLKTGFIWLPLLTILILFIYLAYRRMLTVAFFKPLIGVVIFFTVAVIPQIFAYAKSGLSGHYFLPVLIPCAFLTVFTLKWLRQYNLLLGRLLSLVILFVLAINFALTLKTAQVFAQDGFATRSLFENIEHCVEQKQPILIVANPRATFEAATSLRRYLLYHSDRSNLFLATYGIEKANFYSSVLQDAESSLSFLNPLALQETYLNQTILNNNHKSDIKAIIILSADQLTQEFLKTSQDWFNPYEFNSSDYQMGYANVTAKLYCKK